MLYDAIECKITIANSTTVSDLVDLGNRAIVGLVLPALTSTNLSFKVAAHPTDTPVELKNADGTAITITATTGGFAVDSDDIVCLAGYRWVQIVASVAQAADRTFKLLVKG